jgi:hypothetical protein
MGMGMFLSQSLSQTSEGIIRWTSAIRISNDTISSHIPSIVFSNNIVHVLWFGNDIGTGGGIQYCRSTNSGLHFSHQRTLVPYDSSVGFPGYLAVDSNNVYVTYLTSSDTVPYGIGFLRSTTSGETWERAKMLLPNSFPLLMTAKDSFVYIQYRTSNNTTGLLRSSNAGNMWERFTMGQPKLNSVVIANHSLHGITTVGENNPEVAYYRSDNGGQSWIGPEFLSRQDFVHSSKPSIAVNEEGNLVAAWNDSGSIVFRRSREGGFFWFPEIQLSLKKGAVFTDVATCGTYVAVVWDNDAASGGGVLLRVSNQSGNGFFPIDSPTTNSMAGEPSIALDNNILHCVWSEIVGTQSEIFYRQGVISQNPLSLPPAEAVLYQNYPNPFNGVTHITYDVPVDGVVRLTVFNLLGQKIAALVNDVQKAKRGYNVSFDGSDLPSGVYLYRLSTASTTLTKKFMLLK